MTAVGCRVVLSLERCVFLVGFSGVGVVVVAFVVEVFLVGASAVSAETPLEALLLP